MQTSKVDILLVDDRPEGLLALEAVLARADYNLVRAGSGEEALAKVLTHDFSVILMDVQMPGLDGLETVALIKQREKSKSIPVIFMTANNKDLSFVHRGYIAGAVDYIFKPIDSEILRSKISVFVELHQQREQLKHQAELLRQSESRERVRQIATLQLESFNRYRYLADAVPHIIWKFKSDLSLDYCNRFWVNYSGLGVEESSGEGWKRNIHTKDLKKLLDKWAQAAELKETLETECRLLRKEDSTYRWHIFRAVPELEISGEITSWIVTNTDIDDRKKIEQDLTRAKDASIAASNAKTNFLANMSHEIRTPLGAVLGFAELIANPNQPEADRAKCLETIRRNGDLLSRLIGDILDLSKIEAEKLEVEKVQFSFKELLSAVMQSMDHIAKERGISLDIQFETAIPADIDSDPTRLRQILFNIIGNAIKFTDQGRVSVGLKYIKSESLPQISVAVCDEGTGITKEQAENLFQPFIQADNSTTRKYGGTGLGLSLSRKLARALNGDVVLSQSAPGKGSTFTITFAAGEIPDVELITNLTSAAPVLSDEVLVKPPDLSGLKVLLVEDSSDNTTLITRFLNAAGIEVETAGNGEEGVNKATAKPYDLVLMDIQMPILDGYQATKKLRGLGLQTPIIALTAYALKEERDRCMSMGCNDHLTKPINRKELIQRIALHARPVLRHVSNNHISA